MSQYKLLTTELDRQLLSTPFRVETNWHVFTGAACTGKTTMIEMFAEKGYRTIPESARVCFEDEIAQGRTVEKIRKHGADFQRKIAAIQLQWEGEHETSATTFLDRAIPDSLTFYRVFGLDPNEVLPECFHRRYGTVFIFDQLPFQRDKQLGPEDRATSEFLDTWLARDYSALGYRVVRVPVLTPEERCAFILERISGEG
jgi:predicted ATPase